MTRDDFLKLAQYGNEHWKGSFTPEEVRQNADDYYTEWVYSKEQGKATHTMKELCKLLIDDIEGDSVEAEEFLCQIIDDAEDTWSCSIYYCDNCRKREIVFLTGEQIFQLHRYQHGNPRRLLIQDILPDCSKMVWYYENGFDDCLCEECCEKLQNEN